VTAKSGAKASILAFVVAKKLCLGRLNTFLELLSIMVMTIFESSEEPGLFPYPPNYSSGNFTWQSPYFISSTALITFILVAGTGRFLLTKDYVSGPRLAPNAIILGGPQAFRAASALTKLILVLCFIVIATFVGDAAVIVVRALVNGHWTSSVLAYYTFVSVAAWALLLASATDETRKFLQWSWVQYTFWYAVVFTETAIAWMWAMGILKPRDGNVLICICGIKIGP
jgi:ATP-binding cassette subfamily B (MDR/TAP) protein 6